MRTCDDQDAGAQPPRSPCASTAAGHDLARSGTRGSCYLLRHAWKFNTSRVIMDKSLLWPAYLPDRHLYVTSCQLPMNSRRARADTCSTEQRAGRSWRKHVAAPTLNDMLLTYVHGLLLDTAACENRTQWLCIHCSGRRANTMTVRIALANSEPNTVHLYSVPKSASGAG